MAETTDWFTLTDWFPPEVRPAYCGTYLVRNPEMPSTQFWAAWHSGAWHIISVARNDFRGVYVKAPSYPIARRGLVHDRPLEWRGHI